METSDVGLLAGLFGVIMALIKLTEYAIKTAVTKRNGGNGSERLIDIAKQQLQSLQRLNESFTSSRIDQGKLVVEIAHIQKSQTAMHKRLDGIRDMLAELEVIRRHIDDIGLAIATIGDDDG